MRFRVRVSVRVRTGTVVKFSSSRSLLPLVCYHTFSLQGVEQGAGTNGVGTNRRGAGQRSKFGHRLVRVYSLTTLVQLGKG